MKFQWLECYMMFEKNTFQKINTIFLFCRLISVTREHWKRFLLQQGEVITSVQLFYCTDYFIFTSSWIHLLFTNLYLSSSLLLDNLFFRFDAVVHFAGLKAVGESVQKPLLYYDNNVIGTINLLEVMSAHGCKKVLPFWTLYFHWSHLFQIALFFLNLSAVVCEVISLI